MKIKCLKTVQIFTVFFLLIHQSFAGGKCKANKEEIKQRNTEIKKQDQNNHFAHNRIKYYDIQAEQQKKVKEAEAAEKQRAEDAKNVEEWLSDEKEEVVENFQKYEQKKRQKQQKFQKEANNFLENIKHLVVQQDALDKRLVAKLKQESFVDQNENVHGNNLEVVEQNEKVPSIAEQMRETSKMKKKKYEDEKAKERKAFLAYNISAADDYNSVNQKNNKSIEDLNDIMWKKE